MAWDRAGERNCDVARFILSGLYTATRHDAILGLDWRVHSGGGYVDLARGVVYRTPPDQHAVTFERHKGAVAKRT
jgi:hypothetical protein